MVEIARIDDMEVLDIFHIGDRGQVEIAKIDDKEQVKIFTIDDREEEQMEQVLYCIILAILQASIFVTAVQV